MREQVPVRNCALLTVTITIGMGDGRSEFKEVEAEASLGDWSVTPAMSESGRFHVTHNPTGLKITHDSVTSLVGQRIVAAIHRSKVLEGLRAGGDFTEEHKRTLWLCLPLKQRNQVTWYKRPK